MFLQHVEGFLFFRSPVPLVILMHEFVQWSCNECEILDEGAVEVEKAEYFLYFSGIFGYWPRVNARDFYRVHSCHPLFKDYPQVIHGCGMEETFLRLKVEVMEMGHMENVRDCASMVIKIGAGGDTDVVHVDTDSGPQRFMFGDDFTVDVVHHGLEGRWRVCESEIHDCGFEKTVSGFECCLLFIAFTDADIVIPPSDIDLCVYVCVAEVADEIRDERKGVLILNRECIDLSVVLHRPQFTILFLDEEE